MSDLQKIDDSRDLDLNFAVNGEEKAEGYVCGNLVTDNEIQVYMNKQGEQASSSLRVDFREENPRPSYSKSHSCPTEFDQDDAMRAKIDYDQDSPSNDSHYKGEMDELPGSYFQISSIEFKAQTLHHERGTEDSAHSQESPPTADSNQVEETECNSDVDRSNPSSQEEKVKDTLVEKPTYEFTNSTDKEIEGQTIRHQTENLSPYSRSPTGDGKSQPKNEKCHYSTNSQTESRKLDTPHCVPLSPRSIHRRSTSPVTVNQMLVSPEGSPCIHLSPNGHRPPFPLEEDVPDQLQCPIQHRGKHYSSPERSDRAKRISPHGHLSPSATRTSASPKRSRQGSRQKNGSSLKRTSESSNSCYSPKKYRRHDRSISRLPIQQRDSASGNGRDHRDRSCSRSPYMRDHYSYLRRRYSPRRRSPPRYHSRHHSPRRRPWSPPPNRRNGVGKPGKNLFVAGFSFLTTERDLERKFSRFGRVQDARIVRDKWSGDSRGFGFLSLETDEDADAAIRALDETEWNGRVILVEKSKSTR